MIQCQCDPRYFFSDYLFTSSLEGCRLCLCVWLMFCNFMICPEVHHFHWGVWHTVGRPFLSGNLSLSVWGNVHKAFDNALPPVFLCSLPEISISCYCTSWTIPLILSSISISVLRSISRWLPQLFHLILLLLKFSFSRLYFCFIILKNKSCFRDAIICLHDDIDSF